MNTFIHTFSVITHLYLSEKDCLEKAFREDFFFNSTEKIFVLQTYAKHGLRIHMKFNPKDEKRFDNKHRDYKVELIITPAKLLHPNEPMHKLLSKNDYINACSHLASILQEIELASSVCLRNEIKIHRLDLTKDIETPSDAYSREVIRLAKKSLHKNGYNLWTPTESDMQATGWHEEDSCMFNNHNQDINAKIYNKLADMKQRQYDIIDLKGLLRFELSLKRKFLKKQGLISSADLPFSALPELLCTALDQADELVQKYMVSPMWSGNFLSKDLQKQYIRNYCKSKKAKRKKMMMYRRKCNSGSIPERDKAAEYFEEICLSPWYTTDEIRYIPSFVHLIAGTEDERIRRFLSIH